MEETKFKCPACDTPILLAELKPDSLKALRSLCGQMSIARRKTPPKPGPGRGHKGKMPPSE